MKNIFEEICSLNPNNPESPNGYKDIENPIRTTIIFPTKYKRKKNTKPPKTQISPKKKKTLKLKLEEHIVSSPSENSLTHILDESSRLESSEIKQPKKETKKPVLEATPKKEEELPPLTHKECLNIFENFRHNK